VPLRDHFHSPWSDENAWEGFHSAWANTIVRHLNGSLLPASSRPYRKCISAPWWKQISEDLSGFQQTAAHLRKVALGWQPRCGHRRSPPRHWMSQSWMRMLRSPRVRRPTRHAASRRDRIRGPGNKDRAEARQAFVAKCAAYLQEQIGLIIVDVVTERRANLHEELLRLIAPGQASVAVSQLYAVAYRRWPNNGHPGRLATWPASLAIGQALPTLPLWLLGELPIPIDLEMSYQETCRVLRIE
jgi:hypothetical protein